MGKAAEIFEQTRDPKFDELNKKIGKGNIFTYIANEIREKQSKLEDFESSGLPEEYRKRWEDNPYWKLYKSYQGGDFTEFLGMDRKVLNQYKQLALEYQAGLQREYAENKYNSPEEQVNRLTAAGINPDLNGLQGAGEDTGFNEPESTTVDMGKTSFETITDVADRCISTYFTIANGIKGLAGQTIENRIKEFGLDNEIWKLTGEAAMASQNWKEDTTTGTNDLGQEIEGAKKVESYADVLAKTLFPGRSKKDLQNRKKVKQFYKRQEESLAQATAVEQGKAARGVAIASGYGNADTQTLNSMGTNNLLMIDAKTKAAELQAHIEQKYYNLEQKLLNDKEYTTLWKDERYQDLRTKYEVGKYQASEAEYNAGVLDKMGEEGQEAKAKSMVDEWKDREMQHMEREKQHEIEMAKLFIQGEFWRLAKESPGAAMNRYTPITGKGYVYNQTYRGGNQDSGNIAETFAEFMLKMQGAK